MNCAEAEEILSAAADGEADEIEAASARKHARSCVTCGRFASSISGGGVAVSRETSIELPSLGPLMKGALWVVAAAQLVIGLPMLVGFNLLPGAEPSAAHLTRDGALACVMAVILGAIALRPRWALPLGIVSIGVFLLQAVGSGTDLARGAVLLSFEWVHVVGAIGVIFALFAATVARPRIVTRT